MALHIKEKLSNSVIITADNKKSVIWALNKYKAFRTPPELDYPPWKSIEVHARIIQKLLPLIGRERPKAHIAFCSPSSVRTAFGLAIPTITVYIPGYPVKRLRMILPLSEKIIAPKSCLNVLTGKFNITEKKITVYEGVPELMLERKLHPTTISQLGVDPEKITIVISPSKLYTRLRKTLGNHDRYQKIYLDSTDKHGLIAWRRTRIQKKYTYDVYSVLAYSDLTVTNSPLIARSSALSGTPAIYLGSEERSINYLISKGFPIWTEIDKIGDILREPAKHRFDPQHLKGILENPIRYILEILNKYL